MDEKGTCVFRKQIISGESKRANRLLQLIRIWQDWAIEPFKSCKMYKTSPTTSSTSAITK
jgi:hypothetical protein